MPPEHKVKITDNLLQKILGENAGHVGNGLIGGQWLMRTLTSTGHSDVAYALAAESTYPSWGYMVKRGATTIWELWNGDHGDPGMNSGNHVMLLGDLIIWYYENLAGIKPDPALPAFRHILMKPEVTGDLTFVDASYKSAFGTIKSSWKLEKEKFSWNITVPSNTTATVYIPTISREEVLEGIRPAANVDGIKFIRWDENTAVFEVKSGTYAFSSKGVRKNTTTPYVVSPVINPKDTLMANGKKLLVKLESPDTGATIRYTTDGSQVNEASAVYT